MKRAAMVILCILMLLQTAFAAYTTPADLQERELPELMAEFMAQRGLNESNFSLSYYNTVTGESYAFNDKKFMVAASTYKLPLNMYYYEMEQEGKIDPNTVIPRAGQALSSCHQQSLVWSNNDVSIGMLYNLGDFRGYKECMMKYFTMPREEIDYLYWVDNHYCTNMMMDALRYLHENSEKFSEMLDYMLQAQQENWFRGIVRDIPIAHKYGYFEGAVNDVGIIYTEEPFCLAVYTYNTAESVVAEAAAFMTDYNLSRLSEPEPEVHDIELLPTPVVEEAAPVMGETDELPAEQPEPEELSQPQSAFAWWMVPVALGVFLAGGGTVIGLIAAGRKARRMEE